MLLADSNVRYGAGRGGRRGLFRMVKGVRSTCCFVLAELFGWPPLPLCVADPVSRPCSVIARSSVLRGRGLLFRTGKSQPTAEGCKSVLYGAIPLP